MGFVEEVYGVCERLARKVFRSDADRISLALVLCWYYWSRRTEDLSPSCWARAAVRAVYSGRDLPGLKPKRRDAMEYASQGAGMEGLPDRRPGPDRIAELRDERRVAGQGGTHKQRQLVELVESGITRTGELAQVLGLSAQGVVSTRQRIRKRMS